MRTYADTSVLRNVVNEEPKCVQWKRLGAEKIRKELEGFTNAEKVEYWRKKTEESRARQQETRARLAREGIHSIDDIYNSLEQLDESLTVPEQQVMKSTIQDKSVPLRVYADVTVFDGVFDEGFTQQTCNKFFRQVQAGDFTLVTSELVERDIARSSRQVQDLYTTITKDADCVKVTAEVLKLYQLYLNADLVPPNTKNGAIHFALASVSRCELLVSEDNYDIVRYNKIPQFNAINTARGYSDLRTASPPMIIEYDDTIVEPMCVQWKRLGAARVRKELEGFTRAEELEYWRKKTEGLRTRQQETRKRLADQND